jgi:hypothetical protein
MAQKNMAKRKKEKEKKRHEEEPTYFQKLRARNLILQILRKLLEMPTEAPC